MDDQEKIPGVETLGEEEEISEVEIPEEEDEETEIPVVDQDTEDPGVSNPTEEENAMPVKLPGPIPTNDNNTPTVDTTSDVVTINNESDTEEDESENKEKSKTKKGFSSKSTHHHPRNGAYGKRPEDMDYTHDYRQGPNANTQVTSTPTS